MHTYNYTYHYTAVCEIDLPLGCPNAAQHVQKALYDYSEPETVGVVTSITRVGPQTALVVVEHFYTPVDESHLPQVYRNTYQREQELFIEALATRGEIIASYYESIPATTLTVTAGM